MKSRLVVIAGGLMMLSASARAEVAESDTIAPLWTLQITPYVWAAEMKGDISPFRLAPTVHVNESFSDILSNLKMAGFVNVFGRYDRFVFSADLMYVATAEAKIVDLSTLSPIFPPESAIEGKLDSSQFMSTVEAGYRLYQDSHFTFDVLGGARFWQISNTVTVSYKGPQRDYSLSHKESFSWFDPIMGARAFYSFDDHFSTLVQADVGGFGAGSQNTWQVLATVNWAFRRNMALSAGYKYLHVDYRNGGYIYDVDLHGPVLGFTYRF